MLVKVVFYWGINYLLNFEVNKLLIKRIKYIKLF